MKFVVASINDTVLCLYSVGGNYFSHYTNHSASYLIEIFPYQPQVTYNCMRVPQNYCDEGAWYLSFSVIWTASLPSYLITWVVGKRPFYGLKTIPNPIFFSKNIYLAWVQTNTSFPWLVPELLCMIPNFLQCRVIGIWETEPLWYVPHLDYRGTLLCAVPFF